MDDKQALREQIWALLEERGAARFPGAPGRIPNFEGAERAARLLTTLEVWQRARVIKANPDSPQRPARQRALAAGKVVYMAVPRLRKERCFVELDPARLRESDLREASSIKGAFRLGRLVRIEEMRPVDLVLAGSVAVNRRGARVGKGGGYSDLEYALAREAGLLSPDTPVVTTVHPLQIVESEIPMTRHDIPVDFIVTPDEVIETHTPFSRPAGIYWDDLEPEKIARIPVLRRLACR
nr:5-formyltetrahydrofolate cyclo-ligase [Anaerolineae bacterium]